MVDQECFVSMRAVEGRNLRERLNSRRRFGVLAGAGLAFAICSSILAIKPAEAAGTVSVLYAGSLVNLMERSVGPAFDKATGLHFRGFAGGSKLLANEIKGKERRADVFISAIPQVNNDLMGPANGDWVSWYATFAQSPLVIGYNPSSRFADAFKTKPWYKVLSEHGVRIGRTDPKLDPKGALTIKLMKQAEGFYRIPGLFKQVLGAPDNPAQVLPEETLVGRLQSGQLDAGFFFSLETTETRIPAVALPAEITPKAVFTIAMVRAAPNAQGAEKFVRFLLSAQGRAMMKAHGMIVTKLSLSGTSRAAPAAIQSLVAGVK